MKINGVDFDLNLYDYETAQRYESALKKLSGTKGSAVGLAETIKEQCNFARMFLDAVLGDGTSERLFGDELDLRAHTDAVGQIISEADSQSKAYTELVAKYAPKRAQK